jgi:hypothetical protein
MHGALNSSGISQLNLKLKTLVHKTCLRLFDVSLFRALQTNGVSFACLQMHTELVTDWLTEQSNEKLMKPVTCIVIGKPNRG